MIAQRLTEDELEALDFYVRIFERTQQQSTCAQMANALGWSPTMRGEPAHNGLLAKGYISAAGPRVVAILRRIDGGRVKAMLLPVREVAT